MKTYRVLFAEDVPCHGMLEFSASHNGEAIARAVAYPWDSVTTDPQCQLASNRRIIQIECGDDIVFGDEIPLDLSDQKDSPDEILKRELLDALRKARVELGFQQKHFPRNDGDLRETIHIIDAALAKAEGGAP